MDIMYNAHILESLCILHYCAPASQYDTELQKFLARADNQCLYTTGTESALTKRVSALRWCGLLLAATAG